MAGETVLVVDDREENVNFMQQYVLEPNGYHMLKARNGIEALRIITAQKVDLIISDLIMPRMGGLELLESMREQGLDIPVILMTFHGSEGTAVRAFRLGARDYIMKPFAVDEMVSAIDQALTESRLRNERDQLTQTVLKVNQQLESRVQELRFLYGIGRSVTSLKDLEQILNRIVEAAVYLTKAEEGSLMLVHPSSGELYLRAARGMGQKNARNFRVKINDSIAGQVVQTGRPIMIGGTDQNDSYKVTTNYFVKALINVPLKEADKVVGVLTVNQRTVVRAFTDRHLNLLMALADYATIAIQNARLYAQLTSDVNRAEQSSRDLEKIVTTRTAELEFANQQLVRTEKLAALGYMATGVAKEMETPLNNILSQLQHLSGQIEPHDENLRLLATLEQETLHCRQVVSSLLEFAGNQSYRPTANDLNDVIEAAWSRFSSEHSVNGRIRFIRGFDPHLPQASVDGRQMEQAMFYLIRYACQSMPAGGELRVTTRAVGSHLQVIISDTGEGISPEDLRHVFDPFYKTDRRDFGLGLSISYAVIRRHNGVIEVESLPDEGTTFTIHLPKAT